MENKLKELRHEHHLRQDDLAKKLNVSRQTIIAIEIGKYNPSLELAFEIAAFFDKKIEDIFLYSSDTKR
ncbi:putative transcriptional regulator [Breznakia sp. PF5-3]|uniref:helix-turn-helix transcriptional regulator n=1 Tax=unclassified Breznakia TaxID=2623764 RepID=UPI002406E776|nr:MULTISPECIES: helix-turn-helix transcriptional regulator [unclassified Breznakia]MDF9824531.1 putative transcriptional regulator [Breznakia sp. PM6-1]MDF9835317.1 putative transcriptional regulator [Breznakia sp. PF5-3]MDF9837033.1 putative transcriptional regulator [Breznakia sp. PFB2-8]MDF9858958.1 putative transcriptional regulator [Breznakia sp. PH5-24]